MTEYYMVFHGGGRPAPEDLDRVIREWTDWYADMGDTVVWEGGGAGLSKTVGPDGVTDDGGANPISGVTVIRADTIEDACAIARGCPSVKDGTGSVEVAERLQM